MISAFFLPIWPDLVDKAMMKEKLGSFSWGDKTHVTAYPTVNCIVEVNSKIPFENDEAINGGRMKQSQVDSNDVRWMLVNRNTIACTLHIVKVSSVESVVWEN